MHKRHSAIVIPTAESLARAALDYLGRFAASEEGLRRVLRNRLRRVALRDDTFAADDVKQKSLQQEIENIIVRFKKSGALNDGAFAEMKAGNLRRAGRSRRYIQQKLAQSGVRQGAVAEALETVDADQSSDEVQDNAELQAAMTLARRRRLGKYRATKPDAEQGRKDLGTLARAGFSLDVARRALGASTEDEDWQER